ncbi:protein TRIGALACTOSYLDIACYLGLYCEROL 1, chloroplastic-like isoform X1 [Coffea arabica]|uniref:Protein TRIGALACTOSYLDIACYLGLYCEROL 1, chloroplastic-like isoform X1 n=1 Tax=Coffea arabica TaxID=13443 RepID=A0A6P6VBB0_COFAR|nr:protein TRIGALACTOSYLDIACYLGLYCEROL 1, chloroplastic-like isoform X1 [Coffea arabica]XP_027100229.1 protein TRIGALACTOSYLDIACYLGLYCEROL 1, chloroplastic-like isoform X1 [Coffea arabica]XP_027100230.1 protein TRIGALACTOSYLDIACYLGLYCEROL 1, chloroplastic-like isoform X1 [Coffea arabica]XP_027100231.1 protein TRIGALACTOSYLDIACYLGLYCEROL 1, chloroplastic-like isoform X1 [Coffea arabica]
MHISLQGQRGARFGELCSSSGPNMQAASQFYSVFYFSNSRGSSCDIFARTKIKPLSSSKLARKLDLTLGSWTCKFPCAVRPCRLSVIPNTNDGHPCISVTEEDRRTDQAWNDELETFLSKWSPPGYLWRGLSVLILAGQVISRTIKGKVHWRNTLQQLERVGPKSVGVCLLTSAFVGMAFTIQFVREFTRLGLNRAVGGVLALAFSRELSPVVTSIVIAGRIGSAFAAELGTMQVSEQTDTLRVLGADPVDYLVTPRVIASCIALPFLTLMCFTVGMASSALLADSVYGIGINIILDSAHRALKSWDLVSAMIKSQVFGGIISVVSCAWGVTTLGGAKGVGESTTSAVVISLVGIFIADFALSYCFFQGAGDSLKNL